MTIDIVNDRFTMTRTEVGQVTRKICVSYARLRRSFFAVYPEITKTMEGGDLSRVIEQLLQVFEIPAGLCTPVEYSSKDVSQNCLAEFRGMFRARDKKLVSARLLFAAGKQEILSMPEYRVLHMIAHEVSHIRLLLDQHELALSEFATDVLATLVIGDAKGYLEHMAAGGMIIGYVRPDLYDDFFRALARYSDVIYVRP